MKIDGKAIADGILQELVSQVASLKKSGVTPTLAVLLVGHDGASLSYIKQKEKACETIGAQVILDQLPVSISSTLLKERIQTYNTNPAIHGIIIQRPLPRETAVEPHILDTIDPGKDVDGFVPNSPFDVPVAMAVITILGEIATPTQGKRIIVVGRGETAGIPIARALEARGLKPIIVHSQTPNPQDITKQADILISCVGKDRVVTKESIKSGAILISVGIHREEDGKFHGDYEEEEIADIASSFTPTPGGVGPVNVACLMKNLIKACIMNKGGNV